MSEKARIVRTITDLAYARITAVSDDGKPTYGTVKWLPHHKAGGRSYDAAPTGSEVSIWADGREVYAYEDNQGYDTTLTTIGVTDDVDEDWYGNTVTESGVEEYSNDNEYPGFALIIIEDTTDGLGKTTIFYNAHISQRSNQQGQTSEGNGLSPQYPQHKIACRPRLDCGCVKMTLPSKQKISSIPEPSKALPHITLAQDTATVAVNSTVTLTVSELLPSDATITWTSGTTANATVSNGVVTGVAAGSSVITASITVDGHSYTDTCTVTVTGT